MLGQLIKLEGALMVLPMICSIVYRERESMTAFAVTIIFALAVGFLLTAMNRKCDRTIYAREGFVITALAWIVFSVIGAAPFVISGAIPNVINAFFETVSGFTTTGASILTDVESLDRGILFWRSFTHWIGGMGILVLIMAILSDNTGRAIHIMRAEMPGPIVDKITPRIKDTAKTLYLIYFGLTVVLVILLCCGGMSLYESLLHTFGTVGTGGFGIKNDSMAGYSPYLQWVVTIFMLISGVNFNLYYLILRRRYRQAVLSEELWVYVGIVFISVGLITLNIAPLYDTAAETLRQAFFQVSSIVTTTGYATTNYELWPNLSKTVLLLLMFMGGCAGSTAGGLKVSRLVLLVKMGRRELHQLLHPRAVRVLKFEGKPLDNATARSVGAYFGLYCLCFMAFLLILSCDPGEGLDLETNFTAVTACFNNIGPGFAGVGPTSNFSGYTDFSTLLLSFAMLMGRLEIYPILLICFPGKIAK
jgi:trk system potassium uptake protein TrkH